METNTSDQSSDDDHPGLFYRYLRLGSRLCVALHHQTDSTFTYGWFRCHHLQLAVPTVPRYGHLHHITLREICGERQYLTRHHSGAVCHIDQAVKAEVAQLLDIGHLIGHHHRLWWVGRCRSSHRVDGIGDRQ